MNAFGIVVPNERFHVLLVLIPYLKESVMHLGSRQTRWPHGNVKVSQPVHGDIRTTGSHEHIALVVFSPGGDISEACHIHKSQRSGFPHKSSAVIYLERIAAAKGTQFRVP